MSKQKNKVKTFVNTSTITIEDIINCKNAMDLLNPVDKQARDRELKAINNWELSTIINNRG